MIMMHNSLGKTHSCERLPTGREVCLSSVWHSWVMLCGQDSWSGSFYEHTSQSFTAVEVGQKGWSEVRYEGPTITVGSLL